MIMTSMDFLKAFLQIAMMIQRWTIFSQQNHSSVQRIMKMLTISLMIMKNVKDNKVQQLQSYK